VLTKKKSHSKNMEGGRPFKGEMEGSPKEEEWHEQDEETGTSIYSVADEFTKKRKKR